MITKGKPKLTHPPEEVMIFQISSVSIKLQNKGSEKWGLNFGDDELYARNIPQSTSVSRNCVLSTLSLIFGLLHLSVGIILLISAKGLSPTSLLVCDVWFSFVGPAAPTGPEHILMQKSSLP